MIPKRLNPVNRNTKYHIVLIKTTMHPIRRKYEIPGSDNRKSYTPNTRKIPNTR